MTTDVTVQVQLCVLLLEMFILILYAFNSAFYMHRFQSLEVCTISEECFAVPVGYHHVARGRRHTMADDEEELLQLAIQQSLLEQRGEGETGGGEVGGGIRRAQEVGFFVDRSFS